MKGMHTKQPDAMEEVVDMVEGMQITGKCKNL